MSDTTCLDELFECGISGRYEDIIRDRAVKNGKDKQLVDNAINLLNNVENMANIIYNCNLTTCRYNKNGKCTNEEKRKECVEVSRKVLCEDENRV